MYLYALFLAFAGMIAGILLAVCSKKAEGVTYGKLDKIGMYLNAFLIPVYVFTSYFCTALSLFSYPEYDGFLGVLGWIVCGVISSAPLFGFLGLGLSVLFRKKGKSRKSFIIQFAGLAAGAVSTLFFMLFFGNLLQSLN